MERTLLINLAALPRNNYRVLGGYRWSSIGAIKGNQYVLGPRTLKFLRLNKDARHKAENMTPSCISQFPMMRRP
jgi:hypothetical protein